MNKLTTLDCIKLGKIILPDAIVYRHIGIKNNQGEILLPAKYGYILGDENRKYYYLSFFNLRDCSRLKLTQKELSEYLYNPTEKNFYRLDIKILKNLYPDEFVEVSI